MLRSPWLAVSSTSWLWLSAANMEKREEASSFWMCTTSMYVLYTACDEEGVRREGWEK